MNTIRVIITGSTGMIGKAVLLECLKSNEVANILAINRKPAGIDHPRLKEIIHQDLSKTGDFAKELGGYDACFFCAGVSSAGLTEKAYHQITYDLTTEFAQAILTLNPGITFCYVSGAGTDSSEKGRIMWARIKGKTENALLTMGFKSAFMFRPAFVIPMKGLRSRTKLYNSMYTVMKPFFPLIRKFPGIATDSEKLGKAMIHVAISGYNQSVLESSDINRIGS